jgi:hypothetical protein
LIVQLSLPLSNRRLTHALRAVQMQAKVKLQIDQNAQIAAGVAAFVTLILLFLLGIWLLVLVGLGVSGAVGYRVSQLKKAQAAGQGVSSFEKGL